jgi:protein-histidine pros-kinase
MLARMGLRTKLNLVLAAVALSGLVLFAIASSLLLQQVAQDEVLQNSRIMMESAAGARQYTSSEVAPLIPMGAGQPFHPQAVSAYAAKKNFAVLHEKFSDYSYREAALNPTNLDDRASDWEADIINDFRAHPEKQEDVTVRDTAMGRALILSRPIVAAQPCLVCHTTPQAAPKSMVAIYGAQNGFGWRLNEIVAAQIVSVPMAVASERAAQVRNLVLVLYLGVFAVLFVLLNILLGVVIIRPIDRIARTAEAVSMGDAAAPEYVREGSDQIAGLSKSFNRMRRSLQEALRMLQGD